MSADGRATVAVAGLGPWGANLARNFNELARLAWHIGNRHADMQIFGDKLRIRRDHVLEDMLRGLGARLTPIEAPFDPEGTAPVHVHDHDHHDHEHCDHPHRHHDHAHDHGS